jgi:hypothetical protein
VCMWKARYISIISVLEIEKDIMPTCKCKNPPILKSRHKNLPIHMLRNLHRFGSL